jgi:DNA-directed RNA polymerase specialized sigma24 family protein
VTGARPWLFAIATALSRSRLRSRRRQARGPIEKETRVTNDDHGQHTIAMAIMRLPAEQRIALALRKLPDFDYEEIGRMLGRSSQSARGHVMQAFRKLARTQSLRPAPACARRARSCGTRCAVVFTPSGSHPSAAALAPGERSR